MAPRWSRSAPTAACPWESPPATGYAVEHRYAFCTRVDADGQHPVAELLRLLARVRSDACDVAVGSRFASGDGFAPYRYKPSGPRRFGTALLRRSMNVALRTALLRRDQRHVRGEREGDGDPRAPVHDTKRPRSRRCFVWSQAGLRVDEVPVNMRPRGSGESKLRGKKAFLVVVTIAGTILAYTRWRRRS